MGATGESTLSFEVVNAQKVTFTAEERPNKRGQKLYTVEYIPENPKAVFVWHPGYSDHVTWEAKALDAFARAGYATFAHDAIGHGRSEPQDRANGFHYIADMEQVVDDFVDLAAAAAAKFPGLPVFLGGESMGGLVVCMAVLRDQGKYAGIVLMAPLVGVVWSTLLRVQAMVGNLLAALFPHARLVQPVDEKHVTDIPEELQALVDDPMRLRGPLRAGTAQAMLTSFSAIPAQAHAISLPIFVAHAPNDKVTAYSCTQQLVKACSSTDVTFVDDLGTDMHNLLHCSKYQQAFDRAREWLDGQAGKGGQAHAKP